MTELDDKTLLLKTLHTLAIGHGDISLGLCWKLPPVRLSHMELDRSMHAVRAELPLIVLLHHGLLCATVPMRQVQCVLW